MSQQTVTVQAVKDFAFGGHAYRRGEAVTVAPVIALVMARRHQVSLGAWDPDTAIVPSVPARRKRAYRRRDLVAQTD